MHNMIKMNAAGNSKIAAGRSLDITSQVADRTNRYLKKRILLSGKSRSSQKHYAASAYPGSYRPAPALAKAFEQLLPASFGRMAGINAGMCKKEEGIVLTLSLAGCRREDIMIGGYDNLINVLAFSRNSAAKRHRREYLHQYFIIPGNADTAFAKATLYNGLLTILIPFSNHTLKIKPFNIPVY